MRCDSRRRTLHQHNMVNTNAVKGVFQRETALNFVCLDHVSQDVTHREALLAFGFGLLAQIITKRQNGTKVIGWMPPFRCQPRIIVIQPAYHRANIKRAFLRINQMLRTGYAHSIRHAGTFNNIAQQLFTSWKFQRQYGTS